MKDTNDTQNKTFKVPFKQINTEQLLRHLQERFKRYKESNSNIEFVPINQDKDTPKSLKSDKKPYGPMIGKSGRSRLGYIAGFY